jgi:BirA family biotin operon repressor/biotin-[acetyl-CoA-carboxylase] ligase
VTAALRLPPGYHAVMLDEVDSTNNEAKRRAEAGAREGTLIVARRQTAGRGRRDRRWYSPEGNLYMSLVVRPESTAAQAARLSFVAAVALGDALAALVPPLLEVTYKWPNDLLANRRKCGGILVESSTGAGGGLDWLVIGVGVNLVSHPEDVDFPATSLAFEGAVGITPEALMGSFARHFLRWTDRWLEHGFAPVRAAWLARAHGLGERIEVRLGGERFHATFHDLDEDGALVAGLDDGGTRRVDAGEVFPVSA